MNNAPLIVSWDENKPKEVEEAKKLYQKARKELREIVDLEGRVLEYFSPLLGGFEIKGKQLSSTQFSMRILNETGDETIIWDASQEKEVREAAKLFSSYLERGWEAFAISEDGSRKRRIKRFNAELQEITFTDVTSEKEFKSTLSKFVDKFKQIQMLPKTRPG